MKRIYLLRHGKSDWDADYGSDHGRPLKRRGERAARSMGRLLAELGQEPDLVITSSAKRAHDTAQLAADAGGWDCPIEVTAELYGCGPRGVLEVIQRQDDALESILLVGHQPTWSQVAGDLVGGADLRFPTAALVRIDVSDSRWERVDYGRGTLVWLLIPRLLDAITP